MKYIRTNSLKRLFSLKWRSLEEPTSPGGSKGEENNEILKNVEAKEPSPRPTWKCFSYEEISDATNAFSSDNLVGKGGYAQVYRGILENGEEIAVKRLTKAVTDERKEKEFLNEIGTIGHVCHPNVLSLVGCCIDNGLYLIFHFSSKGSVDSLLHGKHSTIICLGERFLRTVLLLAPDYSLKRRAEIIFRQNEDLPPMDWKTRYKIAIGTARGLHYLHKGCQRRIIHRDIKSTNILLTLDLEPQISDFGLAKWLPSQWTHHSIAPIEGTFGHLAPEYYMHGIVDEKTDVFAFGVILLELISGRKPVDGSHQSLHGWAKPILNIGEIERLVDPRLRGAYDVTQLKRLAFAGSMCIRASPTWRPSMTEVLEVMESEGEIDKERWKMAEEEEVDEFWGFEDLEYECNTSFSISPHDSLSTGSC